MAATADAGPTRGCPRPGELHTWHRLWWGNLAAARLRRCEDVDMRAVELLAGVRKSFGEDAFCAVNTAVLVVCYSALSLLTPADMGEKRMKYVRARCCKRLHGVRVRRGCLTRLRLLGCTASDSLFPNRSVKPWPYCWWL